MKRAILWIMLILMPLISASPIFINMDILSEDDVEVYQTDKGIYIVQFISADDDKARFMVNNELSNSLIAGQSFEFEDGSVIILKSAQESEAEYYFYGSDINPIPVNINVNRFNIKECNFNGECQENETDCCYDCGCEPEYKCENNKCMKMEGCSSDEECDDKRACTQDSCSDKICSHKKVEGCEFGDLCLSYGAVKEVNNFQSYCLNDMWNLQKEKEESCRNDYECTNGKCRDNRCYKRSFIGLLIIVVLIVILVRYTFKKFRVVKRIKTYLFWR